MSDNLIYNISDIKYTTEMAERFLFPFGQLNFLTNGAIFGRLLIIQSRTNEGKSVLASQILVEAIKQGYKCMADFGEDNGDEACSRIYKQFTPYEKNNYTSRNYLQNGKPTNIWEYYLTEEKFNEARKFFDNKLFLYDIMKSPNMSNIVKALDEARLKGCRIMLVDNLENVEATNNETENEHYKDVAITLRNYAVKYNVYCILVCHTRKTERDVLVPAIEDIKGSSAVSNTGKEILTILRTDVMDKTSRAYKSLAKVVELNGYDIDECDGLLILQKTKGRKLGTIGLKYNCYVGTYYEAKRTNTNESDKPITVNNTKSLEQSKNKSSFANMTLDDSDELPF